MARPSSLPRRALAPAALALVGALVVAACTGERPRLADEVETTTSSTSTIAPATEPSSLVAQANGDEIAVYADESATEPERELTADEVVALPEIPITFLVKQEGDDRLEVYLPVGPPGSRGWVDRDDVTVTSVSYRIEVALGAHRLRVYDGDDLVLEELIAVGTTDRPAPGGVYFLKELLQPPDPDGPYGTYAYGLSGYVTELEAFDDGEGVMGIHGTNDPSSIGEDVPNGCIHLPNGAMDRLVDEIGLPLGTPVTIEA